MTPRVTKQQRLAMRSAARAILARKSLIHWVRTQSKAPGGYKAGVVHYRVCAALERFSAAVARKESPRLIFTTAPRVGKTEIVSKAWPVRHLARHPDHEFVAASYGQDLADSNSRAARGIAQTEEAATVYECLGPKDRAASTRDRVSHWGIKDGSGSYKAVGVGGPLTGNGAHILCIDDPFKDMAEADSATRREAVWTWYTATAYTRLAPGGGVIVMATRWHDDDLIGRLLREAKNGGDQWEVISLPAIAEADEVVPAHESELADEIERELGPLPVNASGERCWRLEGQALHPARYGVDALNKIRKAVGERVWAALYQCRPVPASGGMIKRKWFSERYTCSPESIAANADEVWVSADAAKKGKATSDYHAIHVWSRTGTKRHMLDRITDRMGYPEYERAMDGIIEKWRPYLSGAITTFPGGALIEDTANGTTYMQVRGASYSGVALVPFHPSTDTPGKDKGKGARAVYMERDAESGAIVLPAPSVAPWVEDVITWWCAFPVGAHDDDMDAGSQILMRWSVAHDDAIALDADEWAMAL